MSAVALADTLLAAPSAGGAAGRPARDSGARFGEVLDAAGLALGGAEETTVDQASPGGDDGATPADVERDAPVLLAAALLAVAPASAPSGSSAPTEAGDASAAVEGEPELTVMPSAATPTPSAHPESETAAEPAPLTAMDRATSSDTLSIPSPPVSPTSSAAAPDSEEPAPVDDPRRSAAASTAPTPVVAADASPEIGPALAQTDPAPIPSVAAVPVSDVRPAGPRASSPTILAPSAVVSAPAATAPATAAPAPADDGAPASALPASMTPAAPVAPQTAATPAETPAPVAHTPRAVAAQVSPVVVSIAQRPAGTHQLTMTVNPDSLGPVTVRAHIGQGGDVRVELIGATDAGRDALRAIVTDLRRDLAAAMPHATLSIAQGASAEAGADRGGQAFTASSGEQGASGRGSARDASGTAASADATASEPARTATTTTTASAPGSGLDILA